MADGIVCTVVAYANGGELLRRTVHTGECTTHSFIHSFIQTFIHSNIQRFIHSYGPQGDDDHHPLSDGTSAMPVVKDKLWAAAGTRGALIEVLPLPLSCCMTHVHG